MIEPHSVMPPPGSLIRITADLPPYYRMGDMAVMIGDGDGVWADFKGLGNSSVHGRGVWSVRNGYFLIVKEAPQ